MTTIRFFLCAALVAGFSTRATAVSPALDALRQIAGAPQTEQQLTPEQRAQEISRERDRMFMLTAMAYTYANMNVFPLRGYDISAVLVWDKDDAQKTPQFLIERNRNFELQGEINHAEVNALRAGYARKSNPNVPSSATLKEREAGYTNNLKNATIYTTLEPCPMCAVTIMMAKVPKVYYAMQDPGLRDPKTREPNVPMPPSVYGRKTLWEMSDLPLAKEATRKMWETFDNGPDDKHVFASQDGKMKFLIITKYLADKGLEIYKPAYEELMGYAARYAENTELLASLKAAVGAPAAGK